MDTEPAQRPDDPIGTDESDLPHFEETILATTRYLAAIEDLTDDDVRAPSLLPGWTRAHVISHISRNADALARVLAAAPDARAREVGPRGGEARGPCAHHEDRLAHGRLAILM